MSIASALKILKVVKSGALVGTKGTFIAIEVIDSVSDIGMLADQMAMLIMGEDYDPEFRDKIAEVLAAGRRVDGLVAEIRRRNADVDNLHAAIDNLNFTLTLESDKNEMAIDLIEKIGLISATLTDTPTALTWIQGPAARTDAHVDAETLSNSIAAVEKYRGSISFDPSRSGLLFAAIVLKAAVTGFLYRSKRRAKRRDKISLDASELRPSAAGRRNRANAVGSSDMLPREERAIVKKIRAKSKFRTALNVTSKAASAVSLGFTVAMIINRVNDRKSAMKELKKQLADYQTAEVGYRYVLSGYGGEIVDGELVGRTTDKKLIKAGETLIKAQERALNLSESTDDPAAIDGALSKALKAFDKALLANSQFVKARDFIKDGDDRTWSESENIGFAMGLDGLLENYNLEAGYKITAINNIFQEMFNVLSTELNSDDPTDKVAAGYITDKGAKDRVEKYKAAFDALALIAMDIVKSGADRKDRGFDPIQETFGASIQKLLSEVLEDAQHRLRDIRLASQLFVSAQMILERVDEEREKDKARRDATVASQATLLNTLRGLLKSLGQPHSDADVRAYMEENGLIEREVPFDAEAYIAKERDKLAASEWRSSDLDTRKSDRFQTVEQVEITLGIMLQDLQTNRLAA
jgi:hypothetical protein